ncbi:MAG: hypothetical protein V2A61_05325, partial [Calditrichota bacterium]
MSYLHRSGCLVAAILVSQLLCAKETVAATPPNQATLGQTPFYFTENKGQWDERVLYKADDRTGLTCWFERDGLTLTVTVPDTNSQQTVDIDENPDCILPVSSAVNHPRKGHALKLRFMPSPYQTLPDLGSVILTEGSEARPACAAEEVIPEGKLPWNNNYFIGNDPSKWAPDCGNFTRLTYHNVWPGIDVVFYGQGTSLKYDFAIHPGADPADVRLRWLGLEEELKIDDGDNRRALRLATSVGTLKEAIPAAYQRDDAGNRVPVKVTMRVLSESDFGLKVSGGWDRGKDLVIDPLIYSTFLGGSLGEQGFALCLAPDNGIVVVGASSSDDFPTTQGAFDRELNGQSDTFITKFSPDGSRLIFSTYLGGSLRDIPHGVCLNVQGGFN